MMEGGNVYICDKKHKRGKYHLELCANREIMSTGDDLEECKVDICCQIILWNGDGEAVLEFTPEKSKKVKTGTLMYKTMDYNEGVDILNDTHPYDGGRCVKCLHELGERNNELLNLEWKPKNVICSVDRRRKKYDGEYARIFMDIRVYHQKFIDLFTDKEKALFDIQEVLIKGKKSEFVELLPKKVIKACGHVGAEYNHIIVGSWICSECDRKVLNVYANEYKSGYAHIYETFVDPATIKDNPTMFFLENSIHISLVIRNDRWAEMFKEKKAVKGIATNPVVVLESQYVEYPNDIKKPEKFEW